MKKILTTLTIFSALIFSNQSFAQNGFGAGSSFGAPSFSGGGFVVEEGFQKPSFGENAGFGEGAFATSNLSQTKEGAQGSKSGKRNHIVNIAIMLGTGGPFKYYECRDSLRGTKLIDPNRADEVRTCAGRKNVIRSEISFPIGLGYAYESENAYTLNYKFGLTMGYTYAPIIWQSTINTLILNVDNILYADLVPDSVDFLKFDLGLNIRGGLSAYYVNLMPYMRLTGIVPETDFKLIFETNIGTLDIHNSDVKLAAAYEFGTVGIELGYKYLGRSYNFMARKFSGKSIGVNTFFFNTYFKF